MKYRSLLLLNSLILLTLYVQAQNQLNYQNATPVTPEVAAIAKYTDIPVSYSSGTPQIGIPIFSAKSGSLEVPVTLSYNASGIRVEEAATWVGLGWMLSTGPSLSRVVRGLPDDGTYGYMYSLENHKIKNIFALPYSSPEREYIENQLFPQNKIDMEPDIFSFSAMGYSGKFYWNQDSAKFIFSPYQNIRIDYGTSFVLTLPNGIKCYFGSAENETHNYTSTTSYVNGYSQTPVESQQAPYTTSWMIHEIYNPRGKSIKYFYTKDGGVREFGRGGETFKIPNKAAYFYKQDFSKPILQKISSENCDIYFKRHSAIREDVVTEGKSLDTISIYNKNGVELKSYLFDYGYFTSPDNTSLWGLEQYSQIARKRLYLKSIKEKKISTSDSLPPYEFTYNNTALPNRLSASQDYWGYYNGKNNGNFLMPRIPRKLYIPGTDIFMDKLAWGYMYEGANRTIDTNYTQAEMLTKIKYPTGGTTSYFYEPNKVPSWLFDPQAGIEQPDLTERLYTFSPMLYVDPPYPRDYMDTFRITNPLTKVYVNPNLPAPCEQLYNNASCLYTIKISNYNTDAIITTFSIAKTFYLELEAGLYKIECHVAGGSDDPIGNFSVGLEWGENPEKDNFLAGGVRVKKIVSEDALGHKLTRSFGYTAEGSKQSSGFLAGFPVHIIKEYDTLGKYLRTQYVSNSSIPLTTDGQTVRYEYVTEFYDSTGSSSKTQYRFTHDFATFKFGQNDGAPPLVRDWQNGSLRGKKMYEKTGKTYKLVAEESVLYQPNKVLNDLWGLSGNMLRPYYIATEWFVRVQTSATDYAYINNEQVTSTKSTESFYTDNYLLAKTRTTNSEGQVVDNKTWYPQDYNNVNGYNIDALKSKNLITLPVHQETSLNGKINSGSIIKYSADGLPTYIYNYENNSLSDTVVHNRNIVLGTNYNLKKSIFYDVNRNMQQLQDANNYSTVYIWDNEINNYTNEVMNVFPVAVIQNADNASVAYSSFEAATKGNFSFAGIPIADATAATGKKVYALSTGAITKTQLNAAKTYIVSYWSKNGVQNINATNGKILFSKNGWTYYMHEVVNPVGGTITISGAGIIDELRLYPKEAQMTTYTYEPLIGVTSQCDADNNILYYEYDSLNRLKLIRDDKKNVVKTFNYNYQQQNN